MEVLLSSRGNDSEIPVKSILTLEDFVRNHNTSLLMRSEPRDGAVHDDDVLKLVSIHSQTKTACLIAAYCLIIVVSLVGNLAVCWVVYKVNKFHNSTYILLTNIATSDLLITLLNIPFTLVKILVEEWVFGDVMCKVVNYILMTSIYVSTTTMTAIAIGKYMTVIYPLRAKWTNLSIYLLCVLIWFGCLLISLPIFMYSHQRQVQMPLQVSRRCVVDFPDPKVLTEKIMTVATFLLQFLVPVVVTSLAYGAIICRIYDQFYRPLKTHNRLLQQSCAHLSCQFKLVKMLLIVVVVFTLCWLPLSVYHMLMVFDTKGKLVPNSTTYLTCHWIAMSSVCYNPFIYFWMHGTFRKQISGCNRCLRMEMPRQSTRSPPKIQDTPVAM